MFGHIEMTVFEKSLRAELYVLRIDGRKATYKDHLGDCTRLSHVWHDDIKFPCCLNGDDALH